MGNLSRSYVRNHVLLNRACTLHELGIHAFHSVLVKGCVKQSIHFVLVKERVKQSIHSILVEGHVKQNTHLVLVEGCVKESINSV